MSEIIRHIANDKILSKTSSDYSFTSYLSLHIKQKYVNQSFFKGSIFRDCLIENVIFDRSDLDGVHFENCIINNSTFLNTDIRSSIFSKTKVTNCAFDLSFINGVLINECEFVKCSFQSAHISDNIVVNSKFCNNDYTGCTQILMQYSLTEFHNEPLCDCSYYQIVFENCIFSETIINVDSLGQTFGLKVIDIENMKYVIRGKALGEPKANIIDVVKDIYKKMGWEFYHGIFLLNIETDKTYVNLVNIFDILFDKVTNCDYIIKDDIFFLKNIIIILERNNRLPLFALMYGLNRIQDIIINYNTLSSYKLLGDALNILHNDMSIIMESMLDKFLSQSIGFSDEEIVTFKIRTKDSISVRTSDIINNIIETYCDDYINEAIFVKYERGSIIEIIITAVSSVFLLQLFIFGVNGCLIQLTETKERLKVLVGKNKANTYTKIAKLPSQNMPPYLKNILTKVFSTTIDQNIVTAIKDLNEHMVIDANIEKHDKTEND